MFEALLMINLGVNKAQQLQVILTGCSGITSHTQQLYSNIRSLCNYLQLEGMPLIYVQIVYDRKMTFHFMYLLMLGNCL